MKPVVSGPYLLRALRYSRAAKQTGAFDEHKLFAGVDLPPSPQPAAWREAVGELTPEWNDRLTATRTRQFLVVQNGAVTRRWTAPGTTVGQPGRLYSVTKSVLSLAIGIARAEGYFPPLDEPVFGRLTPRNLLRMDSGLAFDEGFSRLNHQTRTYLHPDAAKTARHSPLVDPIAADFHYNDYHSLLLGTLLDSGLRRGGWSGDSGLPLVAAWVWERLLRPLEQAYPGRFVLDSEEKGFPKTESGLCLAADDVARFGQLVLQDGVWNGRQLVPADWVRQSTGRDGAWQGVRPFARYRDLAWGPWLSAGRGFYAHHWWGRVETNAPDTVFAMGIHGQLLVISPRHRAVVVRLADRWALDAWWPDLLLAALDSGDL